MFKYIVGYKAKVFFASRRSFCITAEPIHQTIFKMPPDCIMPSFNKWLSDTQVSLSPGTVKVTGDLEMTITNLPYITQRRKNHKVG